MKREIRIHQGITVRDAGDAKDGRIGTIEGYGAVFNQWSEELGYFREKIRAGAFAESLKRGDDIRAFGHHRSDQIIGRRSAGTLKLAEDEKGLKVEIAIPDTTAGRDTLISVKRGDLTGMSFGFNVVDDEWSRQTEGGKTIYSRELIRVDLHEVSVVSFPAYPGTSVEARSMDEIAKEGKRRADQEGPPVASSKRDVTIRRYRALRDVWAPN